MIKDHETGLQILTKQPSEARLFDMDFTNDIRKDDTIQSVTSSVAVNMGNVAGSSDVSLSSAVISGAIVQIRISAGQHLENYKITHIIVTASGDTLEGDGLLCVRDR